MRLIQNELSTQRKLYQTRAEGHIVINIEREKKLELFKK